MDRGRPARADPPTGPLFSGRERPQRERSPQRVASSDSHASIASTPMPDKPSTSAATLLGDTLPSIPKSQLSRPPLNGYAQVSFTDDDVPLSAHAPGTDANFRRKKSLVRPDRQRQDPNHRLYNYRQHAAAMEADGAGRVGASTTGTMPLPLVRDALYNEDLPLRPVANLRRGKSLLAREEDVEDSGMGFLKRAGTARRRQQSNTDPLLGQKQQTVKEPIGLWMLYCYVLTACCPGFLLQCCGLRTKERQRAWREKMGLLFLISILMAAVGFLTFGFTSTVCGNVALRFRAGTIEGGSMIFHGYDYAMDKFEHPAAGPGIETNSNPLYSEFNAGGKDGSFMFQKVNQNCLGIITPAAGSSIPSEGQNLAWYFPCNIYDQFGTSAVNKTGYATSYTCHTSAAARTQFDQTSDGKIFGMERQGQVYFSWDDLQNSTRNLGVYEQNVLDFDLLKWLDSSQVSFPPIFNSLARGNSTYRGRDITMQLTRDRNKALGQCLADIITVGFIDSKSIGCVAADVVLYVSLVFIIGVVAIKFAMAVFFGWFLSWRLGAFRNESMESRVRRAAEIESWTDDIYRPAPARYRPNAKGGKKSMLPTHSRFSKGDQLQKATGGNNFAARPPSNYGELGNNRKSTYVNVGGGRSSSSLPMSGTGSGNTATPMSRRSSVSDGSSNTLCPFPLYNVVPQPGRDYQPFGFALAHSICLVTAYSESIEGLRTTLDSLATTDYPNSHKFILVIADGMVKGSGNDMSTPEIVLSMMKDFVIPKEEVEAHSYVAIADGHKRHNMAKVYAGFYEYDDNTVEVGKQQRVPMILVAKTGNPMEATESKPGNRGKRDSQMVLMAFLQKVMFDERMTTFEYELFNSIWRVTGVSPDHYEIVLMVDADTKVFPDSLTRMIACMVYDPEVMGLCGETKIANKSETWVTMIQVFEYYISHHLTKAFESMWGGVTCLPGCFSMYRIKAPKGGDGYWVPILANPDIVEHYSENIVDTLHKKNLLLLGEDRYLTTLMLKTFPKRKMMFCPQAVCKTVVPDTFRVLLSQRRRWINSTIHNLFELLLVRDLCGTFCFSMQFVVFMELTGTLVLPAAISFTIYLLVLTAIPGTVKPIIPLILLGIILGLPGLLIVVTSRKVAYLGWMMIYLVSLPIWNFVLPAYAYLNMDDFSWGQTRQIEGDADKGNHGDKEGDFDSSAIVMKRWAEFERDRRWKAANTPNPPFSQRRRDNSADYGSKSRLSEMSSSPSYATTPGYSGTSPTYMSPTGSTSPYPSPGASSHTAFMHVRGSYLPPGAGAPAGQ